MGNQLPLAPPYAAIPECALGGALGLPARPGCPQARPSPPLRHNLHILPIYFSPPVFKIFGKYIETSMCKTVVSSLLLLRSFVCMLTSKAKNLIMGVLDFGSWKMNNRLKLHTSLESFYKIQFCLHETFVLPECCLLILPSRDISQQ